jgi:hypothetical protein
LDQLDTPAVQERIARDEEGVGPLACKSREGRIDLADGADIEELDFHPERARNRLHVSHRGRRNGRIGRIDEHGHTRHSGHQLTQELQPLRHQLSRENIGTCRVAARPIEAVDEAELDRIGSDAEDDWSRAVAALAATAAAALPGVAMTAAWRWMRSATIAGRRSN